MSKDGFILSPHSLLDKLLVICPNGDQCEEVLPKSDLESHLSKRCQGILKPTNKTLSDPPVTLNPTANETIHRVDGQDIVPGRLCSIEIQRGCYDLGISIVGGCDTPLGLIIIQEVFLDSAVGKDGRLLPGDQLIEVNGTSLLNLTHVEAKQKLKQLYALCTLQIYREGNDEVAAINQKEELFHISVRKAKGMPLGIKLVRKKSYPGLYILEVIGGSLAASHGGFFKDDRIIKINSIDMMDGSQEQASEIIQSSTEYVHFVLSRYGENKSNATQLWSNRDTTYTSQRSTSTSHQNIYHTNTMNKQKIVKVIKEESDPLGISVAGGIGSIRGDIPLYVTNIQPHGPAASQKHLKKGDIIVSVNSESVLYLRHAEAVSVLKAASQQSIVVLNILEGSETTDGISNFSPSWKYWLSVPQSCYPIRSVHLPRTSVGSLGFSIVGGSDGSQRCDAIYIKYIIPSSPASKLSLLRCGDLLLAVNGNSLQHVTHCHAVRLLINSKDPVVLQVVSWPGSLV